MIFATLFSVGCVRLPAAPTTPSDDPNFSPPQVIALPGVDPAQDPPEPLKLVPGDVITVRAFSTEILEYGGLIVDEEGAVQVPLAGRVPVGGLSLPDAERRLQEALRSLDRIVRVSVTLSGSGGHRATILGAIGSPGRVDVEPGARLADVLALAGGPLTTEIAGQVLLLADLEGARLVRNGQEVPVSLALALRGDARHNVRIRPGDHVYVPAVRGNTITMLGELRGPTVLPFREGMRLTQALALAGGLTSEGDRSDIHIVRGSLREPRVYRASLRAVVDGRATDVELAPGDIVYVTQEWTANVGEVLARISPLLSLGVTATVTYLLISQ